MTDKIDKLKNKYGGYNMSTYYGITDIPCESMSEDSLGVGKYIKGLEEFIKKCPTPMSIALQGDWGTGKTSFLQSMNTDFSNEDNIITIYFNTWQYSQFNMSDSLYASFINNIADQIKPYASNSSKIDAIKGSIGKIITTAAKNVIKTTTSIDVDEYQAKLMNKEEEKTKTISNMKKQFAEMVEDALSEKDKTEGRLVIFIDDLDRLNPEIAVELLEIMKLFMDVKRCIYVLAIDYEVVVSGVRKKFGSNMSEDKCRSFFDKIIQLPFKMPVDSYNISKMIQEVLGSNMNTYIKPISNLVKRTLGANPRTFKRLANSYFLLMTVDQFQNSEERLMDECRSALLFVSLVIQMYAPEVYSKLISCGSASELKDFFSNLNDSEENDEELDAKDFETLELVEETLKEISKLSENGSENIDELFISVLNLSSITNVPKSKNDVVPKDRQKAIKITKIKINDVEYMVKNPTAAQMKTYEIILKENMSKLDSFMNTYTRILTYDKDASLGFFRALKTLDIINGDKQLYIGTSSSTNDKMLFTKYLCEFMDITKGSVYWYNELGEVIFNY